MAGVKTSKDRGNYVSEWFGHRVYPTVKSSSSSLSDQSNQRCPFLSLAKGLDQTCIKSEASKGICTISSVSNAVRQDWLVCPYRALSPELLENAVRRLFSLTITAPLLVLPAIRLVEADQREEVNRRLSADERVFIYFDDKLGGELSIPATARSPEFAFDFTIFEIEKRGESPHVGGFAVMEIQTMDFHGSYRAAVRNLRESLRMHGKKFGSTLQQNQQWLSEKVEGPNIANVFKRTFYQMMFKFQLGKHDRCAGCVLAIPTSVWDSWQRHLAAPALKAESDGTYSLFKPNNSRPSEVPSWIFVFDIDAASAVTPNALRFDKIIATDAPSMSYYALEAAPDAALSNVASATGLLGLMARRLQKIWPELANTVTL